MSTHPPIQHWTDGVLQFYVSETSTYTPDRTPNRHDLISYLTIIRPRRYYLPNTEILMPRTELQLRFPDVLVGCYENGALSITSRLSTTSMLAAGIYATIPSRVASRSRRPQAGELRDTRDTGDTGDTGDEPHLGPRYTTNDQMTTGDDTIDFETPNVSMGDWEQEMYESERWSVDTTRVSETDQEPLSPSRSDASTPDDDDACPDLNRYQHILTTTEEVNSHTVLEELNPGGRPISVSTRCELFRVCVPRDSRVVRHPIPIIGSDRTINTTHPGVVLFLHPSDVLANRSLCRVYDHRYVHIGKITTALLILSPGSPSIVHHQFHTTDVDTTPVYMNPTSTIIFIHLARNTKIRTTYSISGRQYAETETVFGTWQGRGWIQIGDEGPRPDLSTDTTVDEFVCQQQMRNEGLPEAQHDAGIGFSTFLLPGALPQNAYNIEQYYRCRGWLLGKQEQSGQPLNLLYTRNATIQQMVAETVQTNVLETGLEVRRSQCPGGIATQRIRRTSSLDSSPDCLVLSVVRAELYSDARLTVQKLPVHPSESILFFGHTYELVSIGTKSGTKKDGHWMACVKTATGWFQMNDMRVTTIADIATITNGVHFIYQLERTPLLPLSMEGLPNRSAKKCWANTFLQMIRYSAILASRIGVLGRLPSFPELFCLVDRNGSVEEERRRFG